MAQQLPDIADLDTPVGAFAFHVSIKVAGAANGAELCSGAFAEVGGLEATMEPKVVTEGGSNYGPHQLVGPISFATVVLKRGMTTARDLWAWWTLFAGANGADGKYAKTQSRCDVQVSLAGPDRSTLLTWTLTNAMPVKFKAGDLMARGTDVAIEELHFVHEGLRLEWAADKKVPKKVPQ
jgi:phage tail-like protein